MGTAAATLINYGAIPLGIVYALKLIQAKLSQKLPYPPGPPGLPLVGNLFEFPSHNNWKTFSKWAEEYGDIVFVSIVGTPILVVNSATAASALFEGKGGIYSDRPHIKFFELCNLNNVPAMFDDGPEVKQWRRLFAKELGSKAATRRFVPTIETEVQRFLLKVIEQPEWEVVPNHVRHMVGAIILNITYGYQVTEGKDELVDLIQEGMDGFGRAAVPGTHLVDTMPWLEYLPSWFPGVSGYRKEAKYLTKIHQEAFNKPYRFAVEELVSFNLS